MRHTSWQLASTWPKSKIPKYLAPYLLDKGSTTQWMADIANKKTSIRILSQAWQNTLSNEGLLLKLRNRTKIFAREVEISIGKKPWMLARAVFPLKTLSGKTKFIRYVLDEQPLGELLFNQPTLQRSDFELALLDLADTEYNFCHAYAKRNKNFVWARRSLFWIQQKPILLTEVFLQDLISHLKDL